MIVKMMVTRILTGSTLLGWIGRHPADDHGPGYAVVRTAAGIECGWDGEAMRSLPSDWRRHVQFEPAAVPV